MSIKEVKIADGTTSKIIFTIHVNDAIVATDDDQFYGKFLTKLGKDFELSYNGNLTWFLGCIDMWFLDVVPSAILTSFINIML